MPPPPPPPPTNQAASFAAATPPPSASSSSTIRAVPWMAGWLGLMVVMAISGRQATRELDVFQVMEVRSLIGLLMLAPLVHAAGGLRAMRTARPGLHLVRNTVHYGAQYAWLYALTLIPLAQLVALEFTMPIWTLLLAAAFLGESLNRWKAAAVALGVIGVVLIVRPAQAGVSPGQAIALAAAVGFAVSVIFVKLLTRTEDATRIMFWMLIVQSVLGAWPALATWRWPSPTVWGWLVVIAFCGTFSHYCMARAMRHAQATVIVPMDFLRVPLTALAGWAIYAEQIDLLMVAGTGLILAGNLLNLRRVPARS
ncbi:DMT family transporter [Comamonadaceae bacterium G21597-S1]|nr:DMT family transporter [Comamonadaceae bacterium G21597-S1]